MKDFKYAFSFAEVMITLVIIGVISMIVVPNLLDSSTQRVNNTAAAKADLEVHQAALRIQGECIRWRCIDTTANPQVHVYSMLQNYLRNNGENLHYKIQITDGNSIKVLVDVENAGATNLAYLLNSDGTVEVKCSAKDYKEGNACNENDYAWPSDNGNAWVDALDAQ